MNSPEPQGSLPVIITLLHSPEQTRPDESHFSRYTEASFNEVSFASFLAQNTCIDLRITPDHPSWREMVLNYSPKLGEYLIEGLTNKNLNIHHNEIQVDIPEPLQPIRTHWHLHLSTNFHTIIESLNSSIAIIIAAGGAKAFVELLKLWVDAKKGR